MIQFHAGSPVVLTIFSCQVGGFVLILIEVIEHHLHP
jgi:hypothetical protein